MKKIKTLFTSIGLLVSLFTFAGCSGQAPVYEGMTLNKNGVRSKIKKANEDSSSGETPDTFDDSSDNDEFDDHDDHDEELEQDVEDLVEIEVKTDDEVKYYVNPGEVFNIEIHLSNPNDFEIQSFTLNGKKYANYMFEEGSNMELLILKTTAPVTSGYMDYSIDAIKYIDGTEIKDVDMSKGNKTIKAGIKYEDAPKAKVTSQKILPTSIELGIEVEDKNSLIGSNEINVYLSDGKKAIGTKKLVVGSNTVKFDNLVMSTKYQYGVATSFDLVDGRDLHSEWLLKNEVSTKGTFDIVDVTTTKTSISFDVKKFGEVGNIDKISLYDSTTDKLVKEGTVETREFKDLLSNHTYNLYVDFSYMSGETMIRDFVKSIITTNAKIQPKLLISEEEINDFSISAKLTMTDEDSIGIINSVKLYLGETEVATNTAKEISFGDLKSNTEYKLVISYSYDLNDGNGMKTETLEKVYKTAPHLALLETSVINTSAVSEGETIYLQAKVENPDNATFKSAIINGKEYEVDKSSLQKKIFVNIINNGQFRGGNTELKIEKLIVDFEGNDFLFDVRKNNKANVFIYGVISLVNVEIVDEKLNPILYIMPEQKQANVLLTIDNPTGYDIDKINYFDDYNHMEKEITPIKIDDNHYKFDLDTSSSFEYTQWTIYSIKTIYYSNNFNNKPINKTIICNNFGVKFLKIKGLKNISTSEDLLNMNDKYLYELQNDIDLSGKEWIGNNFSGIFNGNNHKIKNMSLVTTLKNDSYDLGLFSRGYGIIKNLQMTDVLYKAKFESTGETQYSANYGTIIGSATGDLILDNILVDEYSSITIEFNGYGSIGGLVGDSSSSITILNSSNNGNVFGKDNIGGLVGKSSSSVIKNSYNAGKICGDARKSTNVGGLVGDSYSALITNSFNSGIILGGRNIGGIVGRADIISIEASYNSGEVKGYSCVGGILGVFKEKSFIKNCINCGIITSLGFEVVGGLTREYGTEPTIINSYSTKAYNKFDALIEESKLYSKEFYINTLKWDEKIWNFDNLNMEKGILPTLR